VHQTVACDDLSHWQRSTGGGGEAAGLQTPKNRNLPTRFLDMILKLLRDSPFS